MPITPIVTTSSKYYRHPYAEVAISAVLAESAAGDPDPNFLVIPNLYVERLSIHAAPMIDEAILTYHYGQIQESESGAFETTAPINLVGRFVRIRVIDTVIDTTTGQPAKSIVWYGYVEPQAAHAHGNGSGEQTIIAYGLLRLLDNQRITRSIVETTAAGITNPMGIGRGLKFNQDEHGEFRKRGNMSSGKLDDGSFIFSWRPRNSSEWDAYAAIQYLLKWETPKLRDGSAMNTWRIDGAPEILNWYTITEETDGKTVKELLDALIDRRRGIGYYVWFDTRIVSGGVPLNQCVLSLFSFNDSDIDLPTGLSLSANPNQRFLDFENATDLDHAIVMNSGSAKYHRIRVRGARRTTTFTTRLQSNRTGVTGLWTDNWNSSIILSQRWDATLEDQYSRGARLESDYAALPDPEKCRYNHESRMNDRLRAVFRRFGLNPQYDVGLKWTGIVKDPHGAELYDVSPDISDLDKDVDPIHRSASYSLNEAILQTRFRQSLPFYQGVDYSVFIEPGMYSTLQEPSFVPTFAYMQLTGADAGIGAGDTYTLVEHLHRAGRRWGCHVGVANTEPAVIIEAAVPHFISNRTAYPPNDDATWGLTSADQDYAIMGGEPFTKIWVTACWEMNERIQVVVDLSTPEDGQQLRELVIELPDARFDYVLPGTTVEIRNRKPIQTVGGAVSDDRKRLQTIAEAAKIWYGKKRLALDLKFKQIRNLFNLGDLITGISSTYEETGVFTPITSIVYDFGDGDSGGSTQVRTSFGAIDLEGIRPIKPRTKSKATVNR